MYKHSLLEEKKRIEDELGRLGRTLNDQGDWIAIPEPGDGFHADPIDNADIIEDYEEKLAVFRVLESRYFEIKQALLALESGAYGVCQTCFESIDPKRLEANPATLYCRDHTE